MEIIITMQFSRILSGRHVCTISYPVTLPDNFSPVAALDYYIVYLIIAATDFDNNGIGHDSTY